MRLTPAWRLERLDGVCRSSQNAPAAARATRGDDGSDAGSPSLRPPGASPPVSCRRRLLPCCDRHHHRHCHRRRRRRRRRASRRRAGLLGRRCVTPREAPGSRSRARRDPTEARGWVLARSVRKPRCQQLRVAPPLPAAVAGADGVCVRAFPCGSPGRWSSRTPDAVIRDCRSPRRCVAVAHIPRRRRVAFSHPSATEPVRSRRPRVCDANLTRVL